MCIVQCNDLNKVHICGKLMKKEMLLHLIFIFHVSGSTPWRLAQPFHTTYLPSSIPF